MAQINATKAKQPTKKKSDYGDFSHKEQKGTWKAMSSSGVIFASKDNAQVEDINKLEWTGKETGQEINTMKEDDSNRKSSIASAHDEVKHAQEEINSLKACMALLENEKTKGEAPVASILVDWGLG